MTAPETPPAATFRTHPIRALLVLGSPGFRRLPTAAEGYMATHVAGWDALLAAVRRAPPSTAVLVEPFGGDASDPDPRLQLLLASAPLLPVVAAADLGSCIVPGARAVLEWGVSEVVDIRLEGTPEALGSRLRAAHGRPLKRRLEAGVSRYASAHAMTLVRAAAEVACDRGLSTGLAAVFGIKERTLGEWCTAEGLPPPRRLLAWIRVLLAVALLEEATRSWTSVARSTGYVDASGLRRAVNGLLSGVHGGASTRRPGFEPAIAAFDAELHTRRERLRSARKLHGEGCHVPGSRPLRRGWA